MRLMFSVMASSTLGLSGISLSLSVTPHIFTCWLSFLLMFMFP